MQANWNEKSILYQNPLFLIVNPTKEVFFFSFLFCYILVALTTVIVKALGSNGELEPFG